MPRYDGVRSLPEVPRDRAARRRRPTDPPDKPRRCDGIGNRKNDLVLKIIKTDGVQVYDGSVAYVKAARDAGLQAGSGVGERQLQGRPGRRPKIGDLFDARIDGVVADEQHLRGKPHPDTFLAGAKALGVDPAHATVFEDATAGVQAGHDGHFGFVVGLDRVDHAGALLDHGASIVTRDLSALLDDHA